MGSVATSIRAAARVVLRVAWAAIGVAAIVAGFFTLVWAVSRCAAVECAVQTTPLGTVGRASFGLVSMVLGAVVLRWRVTGIPPRAVMRLWWSLPAPAAAAVQRGASLAMGLVLVAGGGYGLYATPACAIRGCSLSGAELLAAVVLALAAGGCGALLTGWGIVGSADLADVTQ